MDNYICTNRTINYKEKVEEILKSRKKEILDFFEVEDSNKFDFNIYIYNTIEELVNGLRSRGFSKDPDYMCACYKDEDNSLNFFEAKDTPSSNEWSKEEYKNVIFHEEIHAIQSNIYGKQPEWLCEGIAKYIDGTYSKGIKYLLDNYINKHEIPSMKELINEFGWHEYDSYDYAYICVAYLIESYGKTKFLMIIKDKQLLDEISKNLINEAINYYNDLYIVENNTHMI